jgi:hypothetical protein
MERKLCSFAVVFLNLLIVSACASSASSDILLEPSPTQQLGASVNVLPLGCRPDGVLLDNLKSQLPYSQSEIIYQSFAGEHILVVWISNPELGQGYPAENQLEAAEAAGEVGMRLADTSVCVTKFDLIHITVVDGEYTQWFSGAIHPDDLTGQDVTGSGGGPEGERGAGVSSGSRQSSDPAANGCEFLSVRRALYQVFDAYGIQAGVYYIGVDGSRDLFLHWVLPAGQPAEESLALLDELFASIPCLDPPPLGVSISVAGQDGVVLLNGYLPVRETAEGLSFDTGQLSFEVLGSP